MTKGSSVSQIAQDLYKAGLLDSPKLFIFWTKVNGGALKPGLYEIPRGQSARDTLKQLQQGPLPVRVTLPEGWTSWQMAQRLEEKGVTSGKDFLAVVQKQQLEGFLFPDTYQFDPETSAERVVEKLQSRFNSQKPADLASQAQRFKLKERDLVILASLVEREARVPTELPLVAGVFMNRIKKGWLLESCATVQYAIGLSKGTPGIWKSRLYYKDLEISSSYNTYKHKGLPPGPIGSPGRAALEAASHPAVTDAMFFVADGEGTHRFSRYYKEHLNAKSQRRDRGSPSRR